jgi:hypothetical protein
MFQFWIRPIRLENIHQVPCNKPHFHWEITNVRIVIYLNSQPWILLIQFTWLVCEIYQSCTILSKQILVFLSMQKFLQLFGLPIEIMEVGLWGYFFCVQNGHSSETHANDSCRWHEWTEKNCFAIWGEDLYSCY